MSVLRELERTWESLAQDDPMWAICTDPAKVGRRWNESDFMATGEEEIELVMNHIQKLGMKIDFHGEALDFGCGIGRLTQALGRRFRRSIGVDISKTMIARAESLNRAQERCQFHVNCSSSLGMFGDESFDFVYSNIVLQHIAPRYAQHYIEEFVRVLKPGGALVFQTADSIRGPFLMRLKARTRIRTRLRSLFSASPMAMYFLSEAQVRKSLRGSRVVDISLTNASQSDFNGKLVFLSNEPAQGTVSKIYLVTKDIRGS